MTWSHGRRLSTLQQGELSVSYQYGIDGLRSRKTVNGVEHKYQYHGDQLIYEEYGGKKFYFFYDPEGRPTRIRYQLSSGGTFQDVYYVTNWRGDVTALYDTSGTRIASYDYDAWGNLVSIQDADGQDISDQNHIAVLNPLRYRGYYYDSESGFYYVSTRYYDPTTHRFLNADTTDILTASLDSHYDKNLFVYCDNNPIIRVDYGGEFWDTVFDVVSLAISVAEVISNPADGAAWAGLAADAVCLATPGLTGGGAIVKAFNKADDVVDTAKAVNKTVDTVKTAKKVDFYVTPMGDAIPATRKGFNSNLSKLENRGGKYYGVDSRGPVRIRVEQHSPTPNYTGPNNPYHCEPHFHIDRRKNGLSGGFQKSYTGLMRWLR